MTSELELIAKQKNFISKIPWFFSASRNQMILIIKFFCLARYSNSDVIFVFPVVDLYNRILISTWYDDLEKSTSSTVRPKLWRPCGRPRMDLETQIFVCDLRVGPYSKYVWTKTVGPTFNISARPNADSSIGSLSGKKKSGCKAGFEVGIGLCWPIPTITKLFGIILASISGPSSFVIVT